MDRKNFQEKLDLKSVDKDLLQEVDAADLHRAAMVGKLFEFGSAHIKLEPRCKGLMKTIYLLKEY